MIIRCELSLYSGQTNPSWELTPGESADLFVKLKALPKVTAGSLADKLGYRGIFVTLTGNDPAGLQSVEVQGGLVRSRTADGRERWHRDSNRTFERWLLQTGKSRIDADTYAYVDREIGP